MKIVMLLICAALISGCATHRSSRAGTMAERVLALEYETRALQRDVRTLTTIAGMLLQDNGEPKIEM